MAKTPSLLPGRDIKNMIAATIRMQADLVRSVLEIDEAIKRLPNGRDKRSIRADHDELKRQLGLLSERAPSRPPRNDWSSERLAAKAIELKDAARRWKAAGRLDKANKCLGEARVIEREAAHRRAAERKRT